MNHHGFGYVITECGVCGMSRRHPIHADGSCPGGEWWLGLHMGATHRPVLTR